MTYTRKRALCWLYAVIMTAVMLAYVLLDTEIRFAQIDDAFIQRGLLGFETGRPASFHLFLHGIVVWPMYCLFRLFPGLPWFAIVQLVLLAVAAVVFSKSIMQCFLKHGRPVWMGVMLAGSVLLAFFLEQMACITYTNTATMLGMAAVAQMFSIDHDRSERSVLLGMCGALALVAYAYALRQAVLLPSVAFCGIGFMILILENYGFGKKARKAIKPMAIALAVIAVVIGGLLLTYELGILQNDAKAYAQWDHNRVAFMDYYDLNSIPQEALDKVGWDEATFEMMKEWCFLNPDISTESYQTLMDYLDRQARPQWRQQLRFAWNTFSRVVRFSPLEMRCMSLFAIAGLIAALGVLWSRQWRFAGYAIPVVACMMIMLLYLAWNGRLPVRAMYPAILPAGAIVLCLLPACLPKGRHALLAIACIVCVTVSLWCARGLLDRVLPDEEVQSHPAQAMMDTESYALSVPEHLLICDGTIMSGDVRAFPCYSDGVPSNITFWGGWGMRSPQNVELFERFGIQLDKFTPDLFFREDIFLASATESDEGTKLIENWMEAELGIDIQRRLHCQAGAAYIYHFDKPEEASK